MFSLLFQPKLHVIKVWDELCTRDCQISNCMDLTTMWYVNFIFSRIYCNTNILKLISKLLSQVRETAPPFRVLEKCQDLCLRDRSVNSLVRTCNSIDFQPGARIAAFSPEPEYEESTCYLTREQAMPEGIGTLMIVPNSVHFNEICLTCKYLL
jgi:hypothetical protein